MPCMGRTLSRALESFSAKDSSVDVHNGEVGADRTWGEVQGVLREDASESRLEEGRMGTQTDMLRPLRSYGREQNIE